MLFYAEEVVDGEWVCLVNQKNELQLSSLEVTKELFCSTWCQECDYLPNHVDLVTTRPTQCADVLLHTDMRVKYIASALVEAVESSTFTVEMFSFRWWQSLYQLKFINQGKGKEMSGKLCQIARPYTKINCGFREGYYLEQKNGRLLTIIDVNICNIHGKLCWKGKALLYN